MSRDSRTEIFQSMVGSWYESLKNPEEAQKSVLRDLLKEYERTLYGKNHNVSEIEGILDFRANFPVIDYKKLAPYFGEVREGSYDAILPEPVSCWVMTRGSTGVAKVLPATKTHLEQILMCGSRALINYVLRKDDFGIFAGKILNLNFPSVGHTMTVDGQEMTYGYSSGTYAKINSTFNTLGLLPRQEDIDSLGSGITRQDWEKRFELAYQQALDENVTATMGVTPVILSFARFVNRQYGKRPRDLWNLRALFCTSVPKIQFKYASTLRKYFGQVPVIEIYSSTEGVFAQQLDDLPYVTPNYDKYLFEVQTNKGVKMLHELKRGEWGKLLISSCLFPRYDIGDLIEAAGNDYFRVFGRDRSLTRLEHQLYRLLFGLLL